MKPLFIVSLAVTFISSGFSQGLIDVGNNFGAGVFRAPIYGPEVPNIGVRILGQAGSPAFPTGTTVYTGARLQGTGYSFGFYASTTGITTDASSLSLIGVLPFGTTAGTAGFVTTAPMVIPGVPAGTATTWQIRAWDSSFGQDYYASSFTGYSPLVNSSPLGGTTSTGQVIANPNTASGWTSFNIYFIPEPGTLALAALAIGLSCFFRRR